MSENTKEKEESVEIYLPSYKRRMAEKAKAAGTPANDDTTVIVRKVVPKGNDDTSVKTIVRKALSVDITDDAGKVLRTLYVRDDFELMNEKGQLVDEDGKLIDEDGFFINDEGDFIGEDGNPIEDLLDEKGRLVDEEGFLINEEGEYVNDAGEVTVMPVGGSLGNNSFSVGTQEHFTNWSKDNNYGKMDGPSIAAKYVQDYSLSADLAGTVTEKIIGGAWGTYPYTEVIGAKGPETPSSSAKDEVDYAAKLSLIKKTNDSTIVLKKKVVEPTFDGKALAESLKGYVKSVFEEKFQLEDSIKAKLNEILDKDHFEAVVDSESLKMKLPVWELASDGNLEDLASFKTEEFTFKLEKDVDVTSALSGIVDDFKIASKILKEVKK